MCFSTYCQNSTQTANLKPNQTLFGMTYLNLTLFVLSKNIKVFQWLSKSKFLCFMTKVNPNNGNKTKSGISIGHIQIWHQILFYHKNTKVFQWLSKSKFHSFMTKVNPSNGNETKSDIFSWDIFKSDTISFFIKKY